jgi:hypothetical protein
MIQQSVTLDLSQRIAETAWETVRARAANPDAAPHELTELAGHLSFIVRAAVAAHANTPGPVRARLAADPHPAVRRAAAVKEQEVPASR